MSKEISMNKIMLYAFTTILLIGSTSSCMFFNATRLSQGKRFFCTQLSCCKRRELCKQIEKNKTLIARHKQNSTINMRAIWDLDDQIRKNIRILNTDTLLKQQQPADEE